MAQRALPAQSVVSDTQSANQCSKMDCCRVPLSPILYQLFVQDKLQDWNLLYGK